MQDLPISIMDRVVLQFREGLIFYKTSHTRSFAKIKSSRKFPNLHYLGAKPGLDFFYLHHVILSRLPRGCIGTHA